MGCPALFVCVTHVLYAKVIELGILLKAVVTANSDLWAILHVQSCEVVVIVTTEHGARDTQDYVLNTLQAPPSAALYLVGTAARTA